MQHRTKVGAQRLGGLSRKLKLENDEPIQPFIDDAIRVTNLIDTRKSRAFLMYYGIGREAASIEEIAHASGIKTGPATAMIESVETILDEIVRAAHNEDDLFGYDSWPSEDFFATARVLLHTNDSKTAKLAARVRNIAARNARDFPYVKSYCRLTKEEAMLNIYGIGAATFDMMEALLGAVRLSFAAEPLPLAA